MLDHGGSWTLLLSLFSPVFSPKRWGNDENNGRLYFGGAPKSLHMVAAAMKLKETCSLKEKL